MIVTIHLPVSRALKNFLVSKFGVEYTPNQSDWFGILISSLLNRKSQSNWEQRIVKKEFDCIYKINIPVSYAQKHGIFLTPVHTELLRKAVEDMFRQNIYEQALLNKEYYEIDYKTTIQNVLEYYAVEENDKSYFQTLMRDFTRKKDKIQSKFNKK